MSVGLTEREREIEALWDQGERIPMIAKRLRLSKRYVQLVVSRLGLDDDGGEAFALSMKLNSAALLGALRRAGPA